MSARRGEQEPADVETGEQDESIEGALDDVDVRDLLRQALEAPVEEPEVDILSGVQHRIRARSRGRFFGDGWSTNESPRATFLITALLMLLVVAAAYWLLGPIDVRVLR
jgi:hypothetical protein